MDLSKYYTDQVYVNADKCLGPNDSHAKVAHVQMGVSENTGKKAHYSYLFLWDPMASCLLYYRHCSNWVRVILELNTNVTCDISGNTAFMRAVLLCLYFYSCSALCDDDRHDNFNTYSCLLMWIDKSRVRCCNLKSFW